MPGHLVSASLALLPPAFTALLFYFYFIGNLPSLWFGLSLSLSLCDFVCVERERSASERKKERRRKKAAKKHHRRSLAGAEGQNHRAVEVIPVQSFVEKVRREKSVPFNFSAFQFTIDVNWGCSCLRRARGYSRNPFCFLFLVLLLMQLASWSHPPSYSNWQRKVVWQIKARAQAERERERERERETLRRGNNSKRILHHRKKDHSLGV